MGDISDKTQITSVVQFVQVVADKNTEVFHLVSGRLYTVDKIAACRLSLNDINEGINYSQFYFR